jgi:hypothetical protein
MIKELKIFNLKGVLSYSLEIDLAPPITHTIHFTDVFHEMKLNKEECKANEQLIRETGLYKRVPTIKAYEYGLADYLPAKRRYIANTEAITEKFIDRMGREPSNNELIAEVKSNLHYFLPSDEALANGLFIEKDSCYEAYWNKAKLKQFIKRKILPEIAREIAKGEDAPTEKQLRYILKLDATHELPKFKRCGCIILDKLVSEEGMRYLGWRNAEVIDPQFMKSLSIKSNNL